MIGLIILVSGLCLGSFLFVLVSRFDTLNSVWHGRSQCPHCQHKLRWCELIPVLSWLWLRRRCAYCRQPISWRYPAVEISTALIFLGLYGHFGLTIDFLVAATVCLFLIPIFLADLFFSVIPDWLIISGVVTIGLVQAWAGLSLVGMLAGGLVGGIFFAWQYVLSRGRWIGAGDIGVGVLMGVALGVQRTLVALFLAYVDGAVVAFFLILTGRKNSHSPVPLATFLAVATVVSLVWGFQLAAWYKEVAGITH